MSADAQGHVQAVLDANASLDIPGKVQQADELSAALVQYSQAVRGAPDARLRVRQPHGAH